MKKHLLLLAVALIAFSAAPAMAGKKLTFRIWNQRSPYEVKWTRTQCDCVYHCDHIPGGTIRPHDMWPPGDERSALIESKDSSTGMDYCASNPSWITLQFTNVSDPSDTTTGTVMLGKSTNAWGPHWHKYQPCGDTKLVGVYCTLNEGSTDNLDIRLIPLPTKASEQPVTSPKEVDAK